MNIPLFLRSWVPLFRSRQAEDATSGHAQEKTARIVEKAERRARKQALAAERAGAKARKEDERRARRTAALETRRDPVQTLSANFAALGEVKRRELLRAVMPLLPATSFIDVYAGSPPRKLDYPHADIYLQVRTKGEEFRLRACEKEPFTIDWIHSHVGAGDVLYDVGANVGVYSLVAAKKPGGSARVFAFEASYASVASLCANIVLNDAGNAITPVPVALANVTGMNRFNLCDLEPGAALHGLGTRQPEEGPTLYSQPVMAFRLDDLVEWFHLPPPNHIKLDVDGGELGVLEGAQRTLSSPALRSILVEVPTAQSGDIISLLERHGLRLDFRIELKTKAGEYAMWYGAFVRDGAGHRVAQ